jgi:hypothetical protein
MESVTFINSPTRLHYTRDLALTGQLAETDSTDLEPADVRMAPPTVLATIVLPRLELGWPPLLYFPGNFRHNSIL